MTLLRPLRLKSFRLMAGGKLVSHLGDWFLISALVGWTYGATGSTGAVALLMLLRMTPPVLGGSLAALLVDRLRKDALLVSVEAGRGVAAGLALAGVVVDVPVLVFTAVALAGGLAALSSVTVRAFVPGLVPAELLPAANAGLGIAHQIAMAAGALAGGVALAAAGPAAALGGVLGASALAATIFLRLVAARPQTALPSRDGGGGIRDGLAYLRLRPLVLVVVASFATATLATGLANASLPRLLDGLGLGAGGYGFGLAALAGGLAIGHGLAGLVPLARISARWIGWALLLMATFFGGLALSGSALAALAFLVLIGLADGTSEVVFETVVQNEAEDAYLGRIFGFAQALMTTTMMGAVAAAPLVNRVAPPEAAIAVGAAVLAAAGAVALAGTRRPHQTERRSSAISAAAA